MLQVPSDKFKELIIQEGFLTPEQYDRIAEEGKRLEQSLPDLFISRNIISKDYYTNLLSNYFNIPFADLDTIPIDENILKSIPETIAKQKQAIAFGTEEDGKISVAMGDPTDLSIVAFLEKYIGKKIKPYLASTDDLNKGFAIYSKNVAEDYKKVIQENVRLSIQKKAKGEKAATEVPIVDILNNLLSYAASVRASDVHLEIFEDEVLIRYRIDGILHEIIRIPKDIYPAIVARVKLLSGMKIDEHKKAQDGRFKHKVLNDSIDIRVSIIPTIYGEKVEMRLLPDTSKPLSFEKLGMNKDTVKILEKNIQKSYGMVIICGPTGSGKSTTLYSILSVLNKSAVNIVTVEDPVEYDMKYVNQVKVNHAAGITFASGLRSILRQDPDIIMVGEIRDNETASISVQAALTGHMLLSSLHTNDAPTAVPRLFDMGIEPFLASAVLNAVLAQRLVRSICKECIYSVPVKDNIVELVKEQAKKLNIEDEVKIPQFSYAGKGCSACNDLGYSGRVGIFEILEIDEEAKILMLSDEFSLEKLRKLARKQGMKSMFEDGIKKAELGITTLEEVLRVVRE